MSEQDILLAIPSDQMVRGRTVAYQQSGPCPSPINTVVIFYHGTLGVGSIPTDRKGRDVLKERGVHYVAITLPGCGQTSPKLKGAEWADTLLGDLTAVIESLYPRLRKDGDTEGEDTNMYLGGGSFGTIAAQVAFTAPTTSFRYSSHLKGMLLLGAFAPFRHMPDYARYMSWSNYILVGPPARFLTSMKPVLTWAIRRKIAAPGGAEALHSQILWDKMDEKEKAQFAAWRKEQGMEEGQLEKDMADNCRRSVQFSMEGFKDSSMVLGTDWGWGWDKEGGLGKEGQKVMVVVGKQDDGTPPQWGEWLTEEYNKGKVEAKIFHLEGGHISAIFELDKIWENFLDYVSEA